MKLAAALVLALLAGLWVRDQTRWYRAGFKSVGSTS